MSFFAVMRLLPLAAVLWQPLFDGDSLGLYMEPPFTGHEKVLL